MEGVGRREGRVSSPLSTERWRLNQRAGVGQRGSVFLRRRNDEEESAPRSSEEEFCRDFTFTSPACKPGCLSLSLLFSPSAAASWVRTAGLLVRINFQCDITKHTFPKMSETAHTCATLYMHLFSLDYSFKFVHHCQ